MAYRKAIGRVPRAGEPRTVGLIKKTEIMSPVRGDWPNYGKLGGKRRHCHINILDKSGLSRLKGKLGRTISKPSEGRYPNLLKMTKSWFLAVISG